jgi:GNAT superfamily N-acetyltransferase
MPHSVILPDGHEVSDDRTRIDMEFVHASLAEVYWGAGRSRTVTERSWANCLCLGLYAPEGQIVGFGRLLTDYALRAHLGDVFVHPSARGRGLSKALVETVLNHPELTTVTHWTLTTRDAHGLYARYGFRAAELDENWMTLVRSPSG